MSRYGAGLPLGRRGPYGTNEGDMWLAPDSDMQALLDADGEGLLIVHEMLRKDGQVQDCVYLTKDPELVAEARCGHEQYVAAQAARN